MNDQERKLFLEESATFHAESARSEKIQALSSFAMAGTGLATIGIGVGFALKGQVGEGLACMAFGATGTTVFVRDGVEELREYGRERQLTGERQALADQIDLIANG